MARPREFDEIEAMDSAVQVFTSKGYEAASLIDLLKSMKLSKSSLYNSFGTKHELFLSAIDHYAISKEKHLKSCIEEAGTTQEKLEAIIMAMLNLNNLNESLRGCLLHNCAIEVLPQDEIASERIANGMARIRALCVETIKQGQAKGDISQRRTAEEHGDFFMISMFGYLSFARAVPEKERLQKISRMIIDSLK